MKLNNESESPLNNNKYGSPCKLIKHHENQFLTKKIVIKGLQKTKSECEETISINGSVRSEAQTSKRRSTTHHQERQIKALETALKMDSDNPLSVPGIAKLLKGINSILKKQV